MRRNKILAAVVLTALAMGLLAGCGGNGKTYRNVKLENGEIKDNSVVVSIGDTGVTYSKVRNYCYLLSSQYGKNFGQEVWDYPLGKEGTIGDEAKEEILSMVTQMAVISKTAKKEKVTLGSDDRDQAVQKAEELMENASQEDKEKYCLSLQQMTEVFEENLLAERMFYIATDEVDTNISDKEAKQRKIQYIRILTNGTTQDGVKVDLGQKEKEQARKRADKLAQDGKKAEDFHAFAQKNTDGSKVEETIGTLGQNTGELADAAVTKAWELKKGQISPVIEGEDGYYIIRCVEETDEDATYARKEQLIEQRQTEMFRKKYNGWLGDDEVRISKSFWKIFKITAG